MGVDATQRQPVEAVGTDRERILPHDHELAAIPGHRPQIGRAGNRVGQRPGLTTVHAGDDIAVQRHRHVGTVVLGDVLQIAGAAGGDFGPVAQISGQEGATAQSDPDISARLTLQVLHVQDGLITRQVGPVAAVCAGGQECAAHGDELTAIELDIGRTTLERAPTGEVCPVGCDERQAVELPGHDEPAIPPFGIQNRAAGRGGDRCHTADHIFAIGIQDQVPARHGARRRGRGGCAALTLGLARDLEAIRCAFFGGAIHDSHRGVALRVGVLQRHAVKREAVVQRGTGVHATDEQIDAVAAGLRAADVDVGDISTVHRTRSVGHIADQTGRGLCPHGVIAAIGHGGGVGHRTVAQAAIVGNATADQQLPLPHG